MFLTRIEIQEVTDPEEAKYRGVSIHWIDCPMSEDLNDDEWDQTMMIWEKVKNGVHALIGNLGPLPPGGWAVKCWLDYKLAPESLKKANP
ncbi:hypothetical protein C4588_06915 [Candidatus Parcubacteria bacterium]|nr:MAG: hypothetical protein C4588_06915 [Candidatus Parcubacteria bacterium]